MSDQNPRTLIRYTDSDGDMLTVSYDPIKGDPEDLWIGIVMDDGDSAAVRIPKATLAIALNG